MPLIHATKRRPCPKSEGTFTKLTLKCLFSAHFTRIESAVGQPSPLSEREAAPPQGADLRRDSSASPLTCQTIIAQDVSRFSFPLAARLLCSATLAQNGSKDVRVTNLGLEEFLFGFFFCFSSFSFCFCSHCWHQRKERNRSRETANTYLLVLAIYPGTGTTVSGCAWRQSVKGHAPGKAGIRALQGKQHSWDLASRVGTRHLQTRLGRSQDREPSPVPSQAGGTHTISRAPSLLSARSQAVHPWMDAPGACC